MAFLPRGFYNSDPSFTPLFRLLSDFDNYSREVQGSDDKGTGSGSSKQRGLARLITPKFDFHETKDTYELHGELPGIDRENVTIEFTDPQTIVIRGHVERTYTSSGAPAGNLLQGGRKTDAITETGEEHHSHKATVEDEAAAAAKETGDGTQVVKHKEHKSKQKAEPAEKIWVSERSFGEFSRTFNFPGRVDQDAVSAKLENGVLNVSIPKAKKLEARRIAIN